jgi:hypothetical protein
MRYQKTFLKFKATWRNKQFRFNSPGEEQELKEYLYECITAMTDYLVGDVRVTIWWESESATLRMWRIEL